MYTYPFIHTQMYTYNYIHINESTKGYVQTIMYTFLNMNKYVHISTELFIFI
jgi:hypothetical protein